MLSSDANGGMVQRIGIGMRARVRISCANPSQQFNIAAFGTAIPARRENVRRSAANGRSGHRNDRDIAS